MIKFTIITLFREAVEPYLKSSMMEKAVRKGLAEFDFVNLREFGLGPHRSVDDTPYGGGDGMLLRCEPVFSAIESVLKDDPTAKVILPTPVGAVWNQEMARWMAGVLTEPISSGAGLEFSSTSYAGRPGEPSLRDEPLGAGRNIRALNPNQKFMLQNGQVLDTNQPIAIGEVGLDYHNEGYDREAQIRLFEEMLQLAVDNDLPVSFHVRNAFNDFFAVVANFPTVRGCVHSFTDSKKTLRKILETTDFYVGVNGLATYSTLPTPPLERILLETDAPFLTPTPYRGMINEPSYIYNIAEWLSGKLGIEFATIEKETTKNAERLFHFSDTGR